MPTPYQSSNLVLLLPIMGFVAGALPSPAILIFTANALALGVLLGWIVRSIDALSISTGRFLNELLKTTLGNGVELMIGISSVAQGNAHISRSIILGSILCNLLLVLGSLLFFAGYDKSRLRFDRTLTTILSSLMMVVFIILIIPTCMETLSSQYSRTDSNALTTQHTTAIILVALLLIYLFFRLRTHAEMFASTPFHHDGSGNGSPHPAMDSQMLHHLPRRWHAVGTLVAASFCMLVCAFLVVYSISATANTLGTGQSFLGVIVVPFVGNFTKYRTIVAGSRSNEHAERGIRAVINSVLRLTMLIAPLLVLIGWFFDQPLTLLFDQLEATTLLLSIVVMTYLIADGRSNYFEGLMLVGTYIIFAFSFYVRPDPPKDSVLMSP